MASFLAAALLTTVTIGLAVIYTLRGTSATSSSKHWFGPVVQIVVGSLAILGALVLVYRHSRPRPKADAAEARPGRIERMLARGAPLAFVAGVLLDIVPGFMPLVALKDIAEMDKGVPETVALVVGFYLIMFWLVEVPLVGYAFAPTRTARLTTSFNDWLDRNAHRLAVGALGVVGTYLIARGITHLAG